MLGRSQNGCGHRQGDVEGERECGRTMVCCGRNVARVQIASAGVGQEGDDAWSIQFGQGK